MKYRIVHTTTYDYLDSAESCHNLVRLQPRTMNHQWCREMRLAIDPLPAHLDSYLDYFGNQVHSFAIYEPHHQLTITAESQVILADHGRREIPASPAWEDVLSALHEDRTAETVEALEFVFDSPHIRTAPALREFALPHFTSGRPLCEAAFSLTQYIHANFKYDPQATTLDTSVEEVLKKRHGVCQDFAHLQIACLRSLGLACRYVSGYLRTDPLPGKPRLVGADASHAWLSVYAPAAGWVDMDPTNGCLVSDRHITIGWGRDFHDVSPVKGNVYGGGKNALKVAVDVQPL